MRYVFAHEQLFPGNMALHIDEETCALTLLQNGERVTHQQFTKPEFLLLLLFFRKSGIHCSFEEALAEWTGESMERCQQRLQAARLQDEREGSFTRTAFSAEMQPVRTLLKGCQQRLHTLGLEIAGLLHFGFVLWRYREGQVHG